VLRHLDLICRGYDAIATPQSRDRPVRMIGETVAQHRLARTLPAGNAAPQPPCRQELELYARLLAGAFGEKCSDAAGERYLRLDRKSSGADSAWSWALPGLAMTPRRDEGRRRLDASEMTERGRVRDIKGRWVDPVRAKRGRGLAGGAWSLGRLARGQPRTGLAKDGSELVRSLESFVGACMTVRGIAPGRWGL
jgi:hypothetical protein